jgi:hypothetical protein
MSEITQNSLSHNQWEYLKSLATRDEKTFHRKLAPMVQMLADLGLIEEFHNNDYSIDIAITDLGRAVLAQADSGKPSLLDTVEADVNRAIAEGTAVELTESDFTVDESDKQIFPVGFEGDEERVLYEPPTATAQPADASGARQYQLAEVYHNFDDEMIAMLQVYKVSKHDTQLLDSKLWQNFERTSNDRLANLESQLATAKAEAARLRAALKPFADQMGFFNALAKTQGRQHPTHLMDQRLRDFQHTSLTLIANPINALSVEDFARATEALQAAALNAGEG